MKKIIHVSDLHFGTESPPVTEALTKDIKEFVPDLLVVSGDLTQRAKRREYVKAREFLEHFDMPWIVIPGNHDIPLYNLPGRIWKPFRKFETYFDSTTSCYRSDWLDVSGLNSVRNLRWKSGRITSEQLGQCRISLDEDPDEWVKVLVVHHNLFFVPGLKDTSKLFETRLMHKALSRHHVDLVLFGHDHSSNVRLIDPELDGARSFILVQAGTALSSRTRKEANSYNRISISETECLIDIRRFADNQFRSSQEHRFTATPHGWVVPSH